MTKIMTNNSETEKKSFLLYKDWKSIFNQLTDEEAGKLIKHIYSYVSNDGEVLEDRMLTILFEPIRLQLERDQTKYDAICERNRVNGAKGGRPKKQDEEPNKPSGLSGNPEEPKKPDIDIDIDNDIDNDNEKESESDILSAPPPFFSTNIQKFIDWLKIHAPIHYSKPENFDHFISDSQLDLLKNKFNFDQMETVIKKLDNRKDLYSKYNNFFSTFYDWLDREYNGK